MRIREKDEVWSFNDFMEHYNQLYTWLNQIQEQYHNSKKSDSVSPRVEGIMAELKANAEKREEFLDNCGKMISTFPDLGGEVGWRVEHVLAKWDMLNNLQTSNSSNKEDVSFIYSGEILLHLL